MSAGREHGIQFDEARRIAHTLGAAQPAAPARVPLAAAAGAVLAADLVAAHDLPAFAAAAMDGWAVAGPPPWRLGAPVLAGDEPGRVPLEAGHARPVATGAPVPPGTDAVLRRERGSVRPADGGRPGASAATTDLRAAATGAPGAAAASVLHPASALPEPGADLRPAGEEARAGATLLPAGIRLNPARIALAAASGFESLEVRRPRLVLLVTGDEVRPRGRSGDGAVRDALGPSLVALLPALGAEILAVEHVGDDVEQLAERLRIAAGAADAIVTTGGSSHGPADVLRPAVAAAGGVVVVPAVEIRPGHPVLVARGVGAAPERPNRGAHPGAAADAPAGVPLVGLPGNPLAALATAVGILGPLVRGLAGAPLESPAEARVHPVPAGFPEPGGRTLVVPWRHGADGDPEPTGWTGSAMLRGIAAADGLLVLDDRGARFLDLPG